MILRSLVMQNCEETKRYDAVSQTETLKCQIPRLFIHFTHRISEKKVQEI